MFMTSKCRAFFRIIWVTVDLYTKNV